MTSGRDDETEPATDPSSTRALLGMAELVVLDEPAQRTQARRERLVPRLSAFSEDVFARTPRRPRWRRITSPLRGATRGAAGAALAAVLAVTLCWFAWRSWQARPIAAGDGASGAVLRASGGGVRVRHAGSPADTAGPFPLSLGVEDRIETAEGRADVNLASGAVVALDPATELELANVERSPGAVAERVELVRGRISVKVPKLPPGSRLVVGTPDSTITVHGTAFVVEVQRAADTMESFTTVSVTEGRVSVLREGREVFLGPGTQWSSAARVTSVRAGALAPGDVGGTTVGSASGSEPRPLPASSTGAGSRAAAPVRSSTLPQENLLLRSAMAARRDGDPRQALDVIDRLLRTYPDSPLGPEARVERARALSDLETKRAP